MGNFTYYGKETEEITILFKEANIKVAFGTKNTIQNLGNSRPQIDGYERIGVYQMKCMDCPLKYEGESKSLCPYFLSAIILV
jgi:hypothetical protein